MSLDNKMNQELGLAQKDIGGHRFEIKLLPCKIAGNVFIDLLETVGPTIGIAIDKYRNLDYVDPTEDTSFAEVAGMLSSQLASSEFENVVTIILKDCVMDGKPFDDNVHLRGEFNTYLELIEFALMENFQDFFRIRFAALWSIIPSFKSLLSQKKQTPAQVLQEEQPES